MPIILPKCKKDYELIRDNCRCKKKQIKKKQIKKKQTKKKQTKKKKTKKKKTKKKQTKKKALIQKKKVKILKKKLKSVTGKHSYSPSVNIKLQKLRSISPHKDIFTNSCKPFEIFVKNKCYSWKSKKVQEFLLDNLLSKKPIIGSDIIGPNQSWNNCWFNTFFVMFFLSDKGRKFMKHFRQAMITGKIIVSKDQKKQKRNIPSRVYKQLWLLNKFITASLLGKKDPKMYASLIDTNDVVQGLYKTLPSKFKYEQKGVAANPLSRYLTLLEYINSLSPGYFPVTNYRIYHDKGEFDGLTKKTSVPYKNIVINKPHMIIIEITDQDGDPPIKKFKKKLSYKIGNMVYKLDSVGVRDIKQNHICALVTINNEDYMFDGENFSPLFKKKWRDYLNKDQNFKITQNIPETYNLTKGYQILMYYRTK